VFTERELNLLTAFANQTSVAIANALLFSQVQNALQEITQIKELMENVFASITSGVITTNADDVVTTYNRAASDIFLRSGDETIGQPIELLLPHTATEPHLQAVREQDQRLDIEAQPEVPGRGRIALTMRLSPLKNAAQETQGVAIVIDDLTEQRERDEILRLMTRYLPPGLVANIHQIAELALGGERREMTCVFIEVIPYQALAVDLPSSQVMPVLNTYLEAATELINEAQGIIDKYMGTDVMVLFNTQLNPQKDHAHAAVKMALDLRDTFVGLYEKFGIHPDPHFYRIGINSGVATLGNVGSLNRRSFSAIGDTINLAKRLQENATAGQIIISEETRRSIDADDMRFEESDLLQVKGRKQQTRIYEVFRS
jgi:class 3 adenylate cyclase